MRLVSVNVGLPREVVVGGTAVATGIFKQPVPGRVRARTLNLDGDRQADLRVHGGAEKAVYAYSSEHYDYWQRELGNWELPWGLVPPAAWGVLGSRPWEEIGGNFGENFTVESLLEDAVLIGDRFRIGSAVFQVTQPRIPCYKLGIKFGSDLMVKRFLESGRSGFYLSVVEEGEVGTGDSIDLVQRAEASVTVADIVQLYAKPKIREDDLLHRAIRAEALPESWRRYFLKRLEREERSASAGKKI